MDKLGLNQIREKYLSYFETKEHLRLPSFSLVPDKDKSLLLINAGMAPLKPYFTGQETPPSKRVATCQKCIRTPDIERVGKTARHGTFFEMLGNFSFGDYFKKEAIEWAWEFVTNHLDLPINRLYVTVYKDDDEAFDIWNKHIGIPAERITRMGKEDNFWEIGVGPCGPCSEIYFDLGEDKGCGSENCCVGCDCDRFVEFWNLVFTQFYRDEDGNYTKLKNPNIDTGMGLERLAVIMQGVSSLFEVDTIKNIMNDVSKKANVTYGKEYNTDVSLRVITDHIRGTVFMVSDGILPSNEGRGYVLRRIIRRAARHGKLLGISGDFLSQLAQTVINESYKAYPELMEKKEYICKVIDSEERKFAETIDQGMSILSGYIDAMVNNNNKVLSSEKAFKLYDTYGFPIDLTKEILDEKGYSVDEDGFSKEMDKQRIRAREARKDSNYLGVEDETYKLVDISVITKFVGYNTLTTEAEVISIIKDNTATDKAQKGDRIKLILDKTPFYGESGGQKGDSGEIHSNNVTVKIKDTKKILGDKIIHIAEVVDGMIEVGSQVIASVNTENRKSTARNHTCTHLLHKALKTVLGNHVAQSGSMVASDRLRFDFTHFEAMNQEELSRVEKIVNYRILESIDVEVFETSLEEAREMGATALFGEKYKDKVRVIKVGDFSMELCGGTHINNTSQCGLFKIISESGVASGVRRIEAVTGMGCYNYMLDNKRILEIAADSLKTNINNLPSKIDQLNHKIKEYQNTIQEFKSKIVDNNIDSLVAKKKDINNINLVVTRLNEVDMGSLRNMSDKIISKIKSGVVVLASVTNEKISFVCNVSKDIVGKGVHAGKLIKEVAKATGGGGGGRPNMAQAGGSKVEKLDEALNLVEKLIKEQQKEN